MTHDRQGELERDRIVDTDSARRDLELARDWDRDRERERERKRERARKERVSLAFPFLSGAGAKDLFVGNGGEVRRLVLLVAGRSVSFPDSDSSAEEAPSGRVKVDETEPTESLSLRLLSFSAPPESAFLPLPALNSCCLAGMGTRAKPLVATMYSRTAQPDLKCRLSIASTTRGFLSDFRRASRFPSSTFTTIAVHDPKSADVIMDRTASGRE